MVLLWQTPLFLSVVKPVLFESLILCLLLGTLPRRIRREIKRRKRRARKDLKENEGSKVRRKGSEGKKPE